MPMTRESPITLPADCSRKEIDRVCEFLRKVKEIDKKRNSRGIYIRYITTMQLYHSGSLNSVDLKKRITTIFKNYDVLLADFHRILKGSDTVPRRDVAAVDVDIDDALSKRKQIMTKFLKELRSVSEKLREEFIKAFRRFEVHDDVRILKRNVFRVLQGYPCLKKEFKKILLDHGLTISEGDEITSDEEDDLLEKDMYFHAIESATEFAMAEDEEKPPRPPPAGVCGAVRRFYKERDWPYPQESMRDDPKLAVRRILPCLHREYKYFLLKDKEKLLEEVQKVNESLHVFVGKSPEAKYETTGVLSTRKRKKFR